MTPSVYDRGFSAQSGTNVFGGMIMLKVDSIEENFKLQSIAIITESGANAQATTGTVGWSRIVVGERGRTGADGQDGQDGQDGADGLDLSLIHI